MELIRPRKSNLSLDMAPLIDVVFQLLIFFMLTASFSLPSPSMKLNLPQATMDDGKEKENIIISISKEGSLELNKNPTTLLNLKTDLIELLTGNPSKAVHIRADENMPYKYFVEVMDLVKEAGAKQINIVHQVKD